MGIDWIFTRIDFQFCPRGLKEINLQYISEAGQVDQHIGYFLTHGFVFLRGQRSA